MTCMKHVQCVVSLLGSECCVCRAAPRQSTKDTAGATLGRKKDRSRSKSPFRSFRWRKSAPKSPTQTSASDDEGNIERAAGNKHYPSSFLSLLIVPLVTTVFCAFLTVGNMVSALKLTVFPMIVS